MFPGFSRVFRDRGNPGDNTDNCSLCNREDYNCFEKSHQCSVTGIKKGDDRLKLST